MSFSSSELKSIFKSIRFRDLIKRLNNLKISELLDGMKSNLSLVALVLSTKSTSIESLILNVVLRVTTISSFNEEILSPNSLIFVNETSNNLNIDGQFTL